MIEDKQPYVEKTIIGEILCTRGAYFIAADYLKPVSFQNSIYRRIWIACTKLAEQNKPIDSCNIRHYLDQYDWTMALEANLAVVSTQELPYHCLLLIEYNLRRYLYTQSLKVQHKVPNELMSAFTGFQENIRLHGKTNDIFDLINAGRNYFAAQVPALKTALDNAETMLNQRCTEIQSRYGLRLLEENLKHYHSLQITDPE